MIATINTDASFSNKYSVGTYAFWIVSNEERFKMSGVLRHGLHSPSQAEMKCICNALFALSNKKYRDQISRIIINTDSLNAIHLFTQNKKAIQKYGLKKKSYTKIANKYFEILMLFQNVKVDFYHIKSHQHTKTAANYVNQWCDDAAKAEMGKKIKQLENKQNGKSNHLSATNALHRRPSDPTNVSEIQQV